MVGNARRGIRALPRAFYIRAGCFRKSRNPPWQRILRERFLFLCTAGPSTEREKTPKCIAVADLKLEEDKKKEPHTARGEISLLRN